MDKLVTVKVVFQNGAVSIWKEAEHPQVDGTRYAFKCTGRAIDIPCRNVNFMEVV